MAFEQRPGGSGEEAAAGPGKGRARVKALGQKSCVCWGQGGGGAGKKVLDPVLSAQGQPTNWETGKKVGLKSGGSRREGGIADS